MDFPTHCVPPPIAGIPPIDGTTTARITVDNATPQVGDTVAVTYTVVEPAASNPVDLALPADIMTPTGKITLGGALSGGTAAVGVRRAVGARVHLRVNGPTVPALSVEDIRIERHRPLVPGTGTSRAVISYTLHNRGNVTLAPAVALRARVSSAGPGWIAA